MAGLDLGSVASLAVGFRYQAVAVDGVDMLLRPHGKGPKLDHVGHLQEKRGGGAERQREEEEVR